MTVGRGGEDAAFEDVTLVARVAERDGAALEVLYDRYGELCFSLARRIVGDDRLAEDVVRDVFAAVFDAATHIDRSRTNLAGWLLANTQHRAVDAIRTETHRRLRPGPRAVLDVLDVGVRGHPAGDTSSADRAHVVAALDQLSAEDRDLLMLAYFGGYTQREIAGITGTPFAAVKAAMRAAVTVLRDGRGDEARIVP